MIRASQLLKKLHFKKSRLTRRSFKKRKYSTIIKRSSENLQTRFRSVTEAQLKRKNNSYQKNSKKEKHVKIRSFKQYSSKSYRKKLAKAKNRSLSVKKLITDKNTKLLDSIMKDQTDQNQKLQVSKNNKLLMRKTTRRIRAQIQKQNTQKFLDKVTQSKESQLSQISYNDIRSNYFNPSLNELLLKRENTEYKDIQKKRDIQELLNEQNLNRLKSFQKELKKMKKNNLRYKAQKSIRKIMSINYMSRLFKRSSIKSQKSIRNYLKENKIKPQKQSKPKKQAFQLTKKIVNSLFFINKLQKQVAKKKKKLIEQKERKSATNKDNQTPLQMRKQKQTKIKQQQLIQERKLKEDVRSSQRLLDEYFAAKEFYLGNTYSQRTQSEKQAFRSHYGSFNKYKKCPTIIKDRQIFFKSVTRGFNREQKKIIKKEIKNIYDKRSKSVTNFMKRNTQQHALPRIRYTSHSTRGRKLLYVQNSRL